MKRAVQHKYAFLRYYYTTLWEISNPLNETATLFKPMFYEDSGFAPRDEAGLFTDIERNIMIGSSLKLSASIEEKNDVTEKWWFAPGTWCNVFDGKCVKAEN